MAAPTQFSSVCALITHSVRAVGFERHKIMLDSPAKTRKEIRIALDAGVGLTMDNLQELERIDQLVGVMRDPRHNVPLRSRIGMRLNTQLGGGGIGLTGVSVPWSKFGAPLKEQRRALVEAYVQRPFLNMVHVHIGSQGYERDREGAACSGGRRRARL